MFTWLASAALILPTVHFSSEQNPEAPLYLGKHGKTKVQVVNPGAWLEPHFRQESAGPLFVHDVCVTGMVSVHSIVTRMCEFWGAVTYVGVKMDVIQVWVTVAMVRNAPAAAPCLGAVYPSSLPAITQCVNLMVSQQAADVVKCSVLDLHRSQTKVLPCVLPFCCQQILHRQV